MIICAEPDVSSTDSNNACGTPDNANANLCSELATTALLQTAQAVFSNLCQASAETTAHVFLDEGSQRTYIKDDLCNCI